MVGDGGGLEELSSTLRESFSGLTAKRDLWFDNYSNLRQLTQTDELQLRELMFVSKMAIPLIWNLYSTQVKTQKATLPKLLPSGSSRTQSLPYHTVLPAFPSPNHPAVFHLEVTLHLREEENFQLEIARNHTQQIFFLNFNFPSRRAVMGHRDRQMQYIEEVVMEADKFPTITFQQPIRINIQVVDDCIFATLWLANLNLEVPTPLPTKHHWCTKDYDTAQEFVINIVSERAVIKVPGQEEEEEGREEEQSEEEEEQKIDSSDLDVSMSSPAEGLSLYSVRSW
ncbi:hypothetical protein Pmani_018382 [Petrolisthes manimaculis]|uniref:Uncharacterized protein n=1 Tax=Petrolisthes manimaculis TaxID=1843537 RepID=A0AAE1PN29_9EUCA|nr:hypothetical protein Pmani_018382 [Petrolisthes manimaculis]